MAERTGRSVGALKKNLFTLRQQLAECVGRKTSPAPETA